MDKVASSVAIVIPAYNEEHGIGATLDDLLAHSRTRQAEIVVVDDGSSDRTPDIVEAGASALIPKAPSGILVVYDSTTKNTPYRDDIQSAAACVQNMLLTADALRLGACWICNLPSPSFLRRLLRIPWIYTPVAYVILGYPDVATGRDVARQHAVEDLVGVNRFPEWGAPPRRDGSRPASCAWPTRVTGWHRAS